MSIGRPAHWTSTASGDCCGACPWPPSCPSGGGRCPGPPGPRSPPGGKAGRNSSGVSLPSPFLSSVFRATAALAISCSSSVPSLFASSAAMSGWTGMRRPMRGRPGPDPSGGGVPLSWAVRLYARPARPSARMSNFDRFIYFVVLCLCCPPARLGEMTQPNTIYERREIPGRV